MSFQQGYTPGAGTPTGIRHFEDGHSNLPSARHSRAPSIASFGSHNTERHNVVSVAQFKSAHIHWMRTGSTDMERDHQMVRYLYNKCQQSQWFEDSQNETPNSGPTFDLGVLVRRADGNYVAEPHYLDDNVVNAAKRLGLRAAMTMSSQITHALIQQISPFQKELRVDSAGLVIPIVSNVEELGLDTCQVRKDAYMCISRMNNYVLLWSDSVQSLLGHAAQVETILIGLVWGAPMSPGPTVPPTAYIPNSHVAYNSYPNHTTDSDPRSFSPVMSPTGYPFHVPSSGGIDDEKGGSIMNEKMIAIQNAIEQEELGDKAFDPEKDNETPRRQFLLTHAGIVAVAMALTVYVEMACVSNLLRETRLDGAYLRWALLVTVPIFSTFSLFFMIVISGSLFEIFGPLGAVRSNSLYYSAKAPKPERHRNYELPHITIQMPVYKEGLKGVIIPTVTSVMAAVRYYEERGGSASMYVNEDGMQLVKPEVAEARKAFYELNNIGWVSRPPHNADKESENFFIRKGKFKKASNMNYCLDFSIRVEDEMIRLMDGLCRDKGCNREELTIEEENELYIQARDIMVEADAGKTWCGGDVRIGELILIIDSDTRVPEDCLLYGALEMHESPEVALLQHASGVMQVVHNAFENGITWFTNLIYTSIQFAVGNGDCAPFVGHNTFARWKALQSIAFEEDGKTKFWSESHVSEDFDVSLRLQMQHFVIRLAAYHNGGFKEGVSLTVYDELARWEKYAYGCNELVFNPFIRWPTRGPFTKLFMKFLFSNIKITSKITIFAYIGTYYAIASAIPLTLVNYLIVGWFASNVDQFYITSWKIFVGTSVIFNVLSPIGHAMLRHRLGQVTFFTAVVETVKWMPFFLLFFGGISFHLLKAIFCHFFSINMEWTTTAKEVESSGFRIGLDRVIRDFKWMYIFVILPCTGGMIYLACFAPFGWTITDFAAIVPLANQVGCHALLPFALGLF